MILSLLRPRTARASVPRPLRSISGAAAAAFLLLPAGLLTGCGDLEPIPRIEVETEEPVPSLRFADRLPSLASVSRRWAPDMPLDDVLSRWEASWRAHGDEAALARQEAVRAASGPLVLALPDGEVDRVVTAVADALDDVQRALGGSPSPEALEGVLSAAAEASVRSRRALGSGDLADALSGALIAADHLRSASPASLGLAMVREAEAELRMNSVSRSYSEVTKLRVERLLAGAREALDNGDDAIALRRAWYALGLVRAGATEEDGGVEPEGRGR